MLEQAEKKAGTGNATLLKIGQGHLRAQCPLFKHRAWALAGWASGYIRERYCIRERAYNRVFNNPEVDNFTVFIS